MKPCRDNNAGGTAARRPLEDPGTEDRYKNQWSASSRSTGSARSLSRQHLRDLCRESRAQHGLPERDLETLSWPIRLQPRQLPKLAHMDRSELEAHVVRAVQARRSGKQGEDDLVEFKSKWPEPDQKFARQLAGSLNRASGQPCIIVVGIDDKTGEHTKWTGEDLNQWWPRVSKYFNQVPPSLIRDATLTIGQDEQVKALVFASDQCPYLVRPNEHSGQLEIPIRDGANTRSANRAEVISLLAHFPRIPRIDIIGGYINLTEWLSSHPDDEDAIFFEGTLSLFVHLLKGDRIVFPRHLVEGEIEINGTRFSLHSSPWDYIRDTASSDKDSAVTEDRHRFDVSSAGVMKLRFRSKSIDWEGDNSRLADIQALRLSLKLPISATNQAARVDCELHHDDSWVPDHDGNKMPFGHWALHN